MELILSAAGSGSGSAFRMRIRIQEANLMRIHADPDPDPKHCGVGKQGKIGQTSFSIHCCFRGEPKNIHLGRVGGPNFIHVYVVHISHYFFLPSTVLVPKVQMPQLRPENIRFKKQYRSRRNVCADLRIFPHC